MTSGVYQSHHHGIETVVARFFRCWFEPINRTIMELKRCSLYAITDEVVAINRTIMELKQSQLHYLKNEMHTINRTIMELKRLQERGMMGCTQAINRTIMELKHNNGGLIQ